MYIYYIFCFLYFYTCVYVYVCIYVYMREWRHLAVWDSIKQLADLFWFLNVFFLRGQRVRRGQRVHGEHSVDVTEDDQVFLSGEDSDHVIKPVTAISRVRPIREQLLPRPSPVRRCLLPGIPRKTQNLHSAKGRSTTSGSPGFQTTSHDRDTENVTS